MISTVKKAISILDRILEEGLSLSAKDISTLMGMPKSTTYKYLNALTQSGLLYCDDKSGQYGLSLRFLRFASFVESQFPIGLIAFPYMHSLSKKTGEAVSLAVLSNWRAFFIEWFNANEERAVNYRRMKGMSLPMYAGAGPKVLLAYMPEDKIDNYLKSTKLEKLTEFTITDFDKIKHELKIIREQGYCITNQETTIGLSAIAAPVFYPDNYVRAVLIVGWFHQLTKDRGEDKVLEIKKNLIEHANKISSALKAKPTKKSFGV